jgi:hypothetical protein
MKPPLPWPGRDTSSCWRRDGGCGAQRGWAEPHGRHEAQRLAHIAAQTGLSTETIQAVEEAARLFEEAEDDLLEPPPDEIASPRRMAATAIPTVYAGIRFRSRLEATWAAFFTACHWPWESEPLDLAGYIPDFVLPFPHGPLLVEVKPAFYLSALRAATPKIEALGWSHEALVVGAGFVVDDEESGDGPVLGLLAERIPGDVWDQAALRELEARELIPSARFRAGADPPPPAWGWDAARLMRCTVCHVVSPYHTIQSFHCRVRGCYDGTSHLGPVSGDVFWSQAKNATQSRP